MCCDKEQPTIAETLCIPIIKIVLSISVACSNESSNRQLRVGAHSQHAPLDVHRHVADKLWNSNCYFTSFKNIYALLEAKSPRRGIWYDSGVGTAITKI